VRVTGGRLALFGDCLLAGLLVALASLPVLTAYPALVAGCAVVRGRVRDDVPVGPVRFVRALCAVLRSGWHAVALPPAVLALVLADGPVLAAGVPGAAPVAVLVGLGACLAAVFGLRCAAQWRPGLRWRAVARAAAGRFSSDAGGDLLLGLAAGVTIGIALLVPVTGLVLGGVLALAAVAVDERAA
jgi:hypothetical protein